MEHKGSYDTVIIGGAVMGSSAAFWLSRFAPDMRILVVEPDPGYSRSSTALSVASIRQQFSTEVNVKISRFGIDFINNITEILGQGADVAHRLDFQTNGYLFLSGNPANEGVMRSAVDMQQRLGAKTQLLQPDVLKQRFNWLNVQDIHLASFGEENEGWFDNMGLLYGLKQAAISSGVQYLQDKVVALGAKPGCLNTVTLQNQGVISAGNIINAAGTFATDILKMLGDELPVEPRKRTVFMVDAPNAIHPDAPLMVCHSGFYLRPEHSKWITAIVPDNDAAVDTDDFEPDLHLFEDLLWPKLYQRITGFDAVKVISAWAGHYAYNTLDQNAIVGLHPNYSNLYLMNGFSGHGLQQAPAIGRGIAELIVQGRYQSIDLSDLSVERILLNEPFAEQAIV